MRQKTRHSVAAKRKYPVGIQSFEKLRTEGYVYADKYRLDGRPITKLGISFCSELRNIAEWKAEDVQTHLSRS